MPGTGEETDDQGEEAKMTEQIERTGYDAVRAQERWQAFWEADQTFIPADDGRRERRYVLDMFPYPSGDLHMGHAEAFAIGDVVARYWLQAATTCCTRSAGTPSACPPRTPRSSAMPTRPSGPTRTSRPRPTSFKRYGLSFDWSRRLHTCDPEYYRWNQWLFLRFFERGLAYRKAS